MSIPDGSLKKLQITFDRHDGSMGGPITALFNPTTISRTRSVSWQPKPVVTESADNDQKDVDQRFVSAEPETLSLELFFDTYEPRPGDVRGQTNPFTRLARIDPELHRPPICRLAWGAFTDIFTGVLTSVREEFLMFMPDGTPVRAKLACTFTEIGTIAKARKEEPHSADVAKTRVVRRSDTLPSLAAEEYGDPALWRPIARENGIVNPRRRLEPGTVLRLPRLDRETRR